MKLLPQIITSIIAIGSTFLAGYAVFLLSARANINEKIENCGSIIMGMFEDFPAKKNPHWWMEVTLLPKYVDICPDKDRLELINIIGFDLSSLTLFTKSIDSEKHENRLMSFFDDSLPYKGRVFFFLLYEYFEKHIYTKIDKYSGSVFGDNTEREKKISEKSKLFPYGPFGVESWIEIFNKVLRSYKYLYQWKKLYLEDYELYLEQIRDVDDMQIFKDFNHVAWLNSVNKAIIATENQVRKIEILLRHRNYYSVDQRLPRVWWIVFLLSISFTFGVLFPLGFSAYDVKNIPHLINLMFILFAFIPIYMSIQICYKDIKSAKTKEMFSSYFSPLKRQLLSYDKENSDAISIKLELVNKILNMKKELGLSRKSINSIQKYRSRSQKSSICSKSVADILINNILQSQILSKYKTSPHSGGTGLSLFGSLKAKGENINLKKKTKYIFSAQYAYFSRNIFSFKTPSQDKNVNEISNELKRIYENVYNNNETLKCIQKRKELDRARKQILRLIENMKT